MQANQLLTADLLDIIFDGKNKTYGAYDLRKTYNNRLLKSMLIMIVLAAMPFIVYLLPHKQSITNIVPWDNKITGCTLINIDLPIVIHSTTKSAKAIKTQGYTAIRIVPDHQVNEANKPPQQTDLIDIKIGLITQDGTPDIGLPPPEATTSGAGDGIANTNTSGEGKGNKPNNFIPIEIEAAYPGGTKAWMRFLERSLSNKYPSEAFEKGIQGTVVVQFIIDIDGSVSNIEAVSGPEELRETATKTIKKSGKWNPALQNGRNIKTYRRQPITFVLQME